jgi:hypothetical protein
MLDMSCAEWRKASHSAKENCVEVAFMDGQVALRDSKDRHGPVLLFSAAEWRSFVHGVKAGEFEPR